MTTPSSSAKFLALSRLLFCLIGVMALFPSAGFAQVRSTVGGYEVSGPYHYKNLSVFLIHGKDQFSGRKIITLEEGLARGIVKVYETGSVNQLEIENLSNDTEIYIQAGDIVKGGRQDRTLGIDLTLAPNSGKVPIASFCVERGRWTQRGEEPSTEFNSSTAAVTSNGLRLAIKESRNQSEVWENVGVMQTKLSENVGVMVNAVGRSVPVATADTVGVIDRITGTDIAVGAVGLSEISDEQIVVDNIEANTANQAITMNEILDQRIYEVEDIDRSAAYRPVQDVSGFAAESYYGSGNSSVSTTTSLQLSLENAELIDEVEEYMAALREIIKEHDDVIGFAFTINGEMKNADVYGSGELFGQLWPKLLRAAATEAVSEQQSEGEDQVGSIDAVRHCFTDAEKAAAEKEEIDSKIIMVTRKSEENVLFETQEKGEDDWLHRNYMKLE